MVVWPVVVPASTRMAFPDIVRVSAATALKGVVGIPPPTEDYEYMRGGTPGRRCAARAAESFAADSSLTALEVRISPLSGTRKIVEVIFSYTNRNTDGTEKSLFVSTGSNSFTS